MYFVKIKKRISSAGWKAQIFSQEGKTVLTKSNLSDTPLFIMHGIKFPTNISKEINNTNRNFF